MKCLVLGGGGFIGSHLCDGLVEAGHYVRVFEKEGRSKANILHLGDCVEWMEGDFFNPEDLKAAVDGIDIIFHLISTTLPKSSNENPVYDVSSNVVSTLHLLDAARSARVRKVVYFSSGGTVYGVPQAIPISEDHPTEPICSYGIHKLMIEKYLALYYKLHGLDYGVMRVSNPYGERLCPESTQGAIGVFLCKALKREPLEIWGDGSIVRDYLHVTDVVRAALKLIDTKSPEKIINIGSGKGLTLSDIVDGIEKVTGFKVKVNYTPARAFDVPSNILDISRAQKILDWSPEVDLQSGLRRTAEYFRSQA